MKKVITFGEIMLRLSPPNSLRFSQANRFDIVYGGGESNVSVSLANYNVPVEFVTRLPKNDIAQCALREMSRYKVGTQYIVEGGERLGVYFLETGAINRGSKVVYDRAHSSMSTIEPGMVNWREAFKDAQWFHWTGITPGLSQSAADACIEAVEVASAMGITISTDFNYRTNLWDYNGDREAIMTKLIAQCDIIIGNEKDAALHFGIKPKGFDETPQGEHLKEEAFISICKQMQAKFPKIKKIITTLRGSISASHNTWEGVLYDGETLFKSTKHQLTHLVDRVGGGDSFMGALIYGLIHYPRDDQKTLNFAIAASGLKHTIKGDVNLASINEIEKLLKGDSSGRVAR